MGKRSFKQFEDELRAQRIKRDIEKIGSKKYHNLRLREVLRSRNRFLLKSVERGGLCEMSTGCTREVLKKHLEKTFAPGMSWEKKGYYEWHIDHIIPLCKFDLTDPEQFKKAAHYTNLQILSQKENSKYHGKIKPPEGIKEHKSYPQFTPCDKKHTDI